MSFSGEFADAVLRGAACRCRSRGVKAACAVVNLSGDLVGFYRDDGVPGPFGRLAMSRAYTAARLLQPSSSAELLAASQPELWRGMVQSTPRCTPVTSERLVADAGGVPVEVDGQVVGALAIASPAIGDDRRADLDEEIANSALEALGDEPQLSETLTGADDDAWLSIMTAARLTEAAVTASTEMDSSTSIAIVGADGDLLVMRAMEPNGSLLASDCAKSKAYVAWRFGMNGPKLEALGERTALWTALSDMTPEVALPSEGAVTLLSERGARVGGIGVAGTLDRDYVVAEGAARATSVRFIERTPH